ncbi:MAG: hypothetical protein JJD92_06100 [Frankiaceae bacterium]|nr:hypothetical protein [Frankiaceae bacterium]
MPTSTRARGASRWLVLAGLLAVAWLVTPQPVPLYDGIGFPDEPYRFVPARSTSIPAATVGEVELKVAGGSNTGGLIVNSKEAGPQISVYAPPHAFAAAGTAPIVLRAEPVPPTPPLPDGTLDSNVYRLSLTSAAGPVTIVTAAQPPAITMRAVTIAPTLPVIEYRATPTESWRELKTRRVGRDNFNASAPGVGEYVLVQRDVQAPTPSSSRGPLYAVIGATTVLMVLVLVGVRVLSRRAAEQQQQQPPS